MAQIRCWVFKRHQAMAGIWVELVVSVLMGVVEGTPSSREEGMVFWGVP